MIKSVDKIDNWHLERWAKFTASESYKLLETKAAKEFFEKGAITYIEERAMQMLTSMWERPELEENKTLLYGKAYEYPAYVRFIKESKNYGMVYMGDENPTFLSYEPLMYDVGGTPDVAYIDGDNGTVDAGAEIKCPKNPMYHFRRLLWKNQYDIKDNYIQCYTQIQMLMMITNSKLWYFVSYDERQKIVKNQIKIIEVTPEESFQKNLRIRLKQAVKEKYKVISNVLNENITCYEDFKKYEVYNS